MKWGLLLLTFMLLALFSYQRLGQLSVGMGAEQEVAEVLYVPDGRVLGLLSFGYSNVLAHVLWFKTISYFGKHYRSDQNYRWLKHMCGLVTELNPQAAHVFEFCSLMLAWEAGDSAGALEMLSRAIEAQPDRWRFYYLRGINQAFFMHNEQAAQADFVKGSQLPGAPQFMVRLATKQLANLREPETAVEFLEQMLAQAGDPQEREALKEHQLKVVHEIRLRHLEMALERYRQQFGRAPNNVDELALVGIVASDLKDPFGGSYYLNQLGEIGSTSKVKRVRLFRKGDQAK